MDKNHEQKFKSKKSKSGFFFKLVWRMTTITLGLLLVLLLLLHIPFLQKQIINLSVETAASKMNKEISFDSIHISLLGTVEARNLVIKHDPMFGPEPLFSVEHIYLVFDPLSLVKDRIHIYELYVNNAEFRQIFFPGKVHNLQKIPGKRKPRNRVRDNDDSKIREVFARCQVDHINLKNIRYELDHQPSGYTLEAPLCQMESNYVKDKDVMFTRITGYGVKTSIPDTLNATADINITADAWGGGVKNALVKIISNNGKTWIFSQCTLDNYTQPVLDFDGSIRSVLNDVPDITRKKTHLDGTATVWFHGKGLAEDLTVTGKVKGNNIEFEKFNIADFSGNLLYYDQLITATDCTGKAYTGSYSGNGDIFFKKNNKGMNLKVDVTDVDLAGITRDLEIPIELKTTTQAEMIISSEGFASEDIRINGIASGTEDSASSSQPLSLTAEFEMQSGVFGLPVSVLENEDMRITVKNARFHRSILTGEVSGYSSKTDQLLEKISSIYTKPLKTVALKGESAFDLLLSGTIKDYVVDSDFVIKDANFDSINLGMVKGHAQVNPEIIHLTNLDIQSDDIMLDGFIDLKMPGENKSTLELISKMDLNIQHLNLQTVSSEKQLIDGELTGHFFINPSDEIQKPSSFLAQKLHYKGLDFNNVKTDFFWTPTGFMELDATAEIADGSFSVLGSLPYDNPLDLKAEFLGVSLDKISYLNTVHAHGKADILIKSIDPNDSLETTNLIDTLKTQEFTQREENIEKFSISVASTNLSIANSSPGPLFVSGQIEMGENPVLSWNGQWNKPMLISEGSVVLTETLNGNLYAEFSSLPVESPIRIFKKDDSWPVTGLVTGNTKIHGSLNDIRQLSLKADVSHLALNVAGVDLDLEDSSSLTLQQGLLDIDTCHLKSSEGSIEINGQLGIDGDAEMSFAGNLQLNQLDNLSGMFENSSGNAEIDLQISGPIGDPDFTGSVYLQEFYSYIPMFDLILEDYHSELQFNQKIGKVIYFEGISGGSYFGGEGELGLMGWVPDLVDISLSGDDIDFEYPKGFNSLANVELSLTGNLPEMSIGGHIDLVNASYTNRINYKTMIINESRAKLAINRSKRKVGRQADSTSKFNPRFNLSIEGQDNLYIDNNLARVELKLKLDILGSLKKPQILGHIDALSGDVTFMQRTFELMTASIDFSDPVTIDPLVNLQAETTIDDYRVALDINGRLYSDLNIKPSSSPPLTDLDLWNLMLIGKTRDSMTSAADDYLASGVAYVTGSLQEQIEQRFEYWMGFDEFSIDPIMSTSDESPSAKFTVKKRFGPDLSVLYSRSASSAGDLLLIEYQISDNLFILGQKSEDNSVGADLRYRWEFE